MNFKRGLNYTYVMFLYKEDIFRGIKVGKTEISPNVRRTQILKTDGDKFDFDYADIISVKTHNSPHLMYATECILHQIANRYRNFEQKKSDFFIMKEDEPIITILDEHLDGLEKAIKLEHERAVKILEEEFSYNLEF